MVVAAAFPGLYDPLAWRETVYPSGQRTVHPQFSDGTAIEIFISILLIWFI